MPDCFSGSGRNSKNVMMWTNYHSHCSFCDGRESMEEFVKFAIAKGFRKYGFSSHGPIPFQTSWNMNADDYPEYVTEFQRLKSKYSDKIELYLGLEVDFIDGCTNAKTEFYKNLKLDYAIGSIHYLDLLESGKYWSVDGKLEEFKIGLDEICEGNIRKATEHYYESMHKMLEIGGFDIVGHFDKITLHGVNFPDFDTNSVWYQNLINDFLQHVKQKNYVVEINTKAFVNYGVTYPDKSIYKSLFELKIPITVNSDCHYPDKIAIGYTETYNTLKQTGFKTLCQLEQGSWVEMEF
jgi:histidinol-phosphatase (PHP family)